MKVPDITEPSPTGTVDVVAVSIEGSKILWVDPDKTKSNADAIICMAIARQGVEDRFFTGTIPGKYKRGDKYDGDGL